MKKMYAFAATLLAATLAAGAAETFIRGNIGGKNAEIKNDASGKTSAVVKCEIPNGFDSIDYASLACVGVEKKEGTGNTSLTLWLDGKPVAACTLPVRDTVLAAQFIITDAVRKAVAEGKHSLDFKVSQEGIAGAQRPFNLQNADMKIVSGEKPFDLDAALRPVFKSGVMYRESVFPMSGEDGSLPKAKLFFTPQKVMEATTFDDSGKLVRLQEGKDFKVSGDMFEVLPNSKIRSIPYDMIYSATKEGAEKFKPYFNFENPKCFAFFREGDWFHKHHIYVTYRHSDSIKSPPGGTDLTKLPKTLAKLKAGKPVKIVLFGDSISAGANASGICRVQPFMPSWGDLVAQKLRAYYKADVTYLNRALGGMNSPWGDKNAPTLAAADKPDLAIIAFGMNDRMPAEEFAKLQKNIMEKIRAQNPNVEFVFVASMRANPMWKNFAVHDEYRLELKKLEKTGVAVADVRAAHTALLQKKRFIDMTGNNVNHPNDFLIRVYAQTVLEKLLPSQGL